MPQWMRRYLTSRNLEQHFLIALVAAIVARILCAWFVYGPQALDDYKHGVWPAYQFFSGQAMNLPDYRSPLLVWMLAGFLQVGSWFSVESALAQVRTMYLGLAGLSLLSLIGTYLYVRLFRSWSLSSLALYLVALFPVFPFISTRAFGEAVAMSFVTFAVAVLEWARREQDKNFGLWFLGFVALGIATLFRFHCGLIYLTYLIFLMFQRQRLGVLASIAAGLVTLVLEAGIDLLAHKSALSTIWIYLSENEGGGAKYGVSPWYNPWLLVLALTLFPFSAVFYRHIRSLWIEHRPVVIAFLLFVLAHSLAAHKEERFLYPVLGLEMWFLAWLWGQGEKERWVRSLYAPVFLFLTLPLLILICFVNTQEGEIEPPALAEKKYKSVIYLDYNSLFGKSRFQNYFLRPPSVSLPVAREELNATKVDEALQSHAQLKAAVLITSDPDGAQTLLAMANIHTGSAVCGDIQQSGSLVDRLLFAMNPKHNQRRRPTWFIVCERGTG